MTVITRFAPSPTGFLHIGSARTALFNWLYARHYDGKFLLRVEDTDRKRSTDAAIQAIIDGLEWLGLDYDDAVYYQSEHANRHMEVAQQLLESGNAYKCYCTPEELQAMRDKAEAEKKVFRYDGVWRDRDPADEPDGMPFTVRLKAPQEGSVAIHDLVQGEVTVSNDDIDDMVLLRSDGTPTYMLAVVVDDYDMKVSHVIRGDDHLTNAFRQKAIYDAMGWELPKFSHIPLIHGPDGAKMSKRHGALGVDAYRDMGYLPDAMLNYLLRLGWSHGDDEIISQDQAIQWFGLDHVGKSPARFDFTKLENLNGHYIREANNIYLVNLVKPLLTEMGLESYMTEEGINRLMKGMDGLKERAKIVTELAQQAAFYLKRPPFEEKAFKLLNEGGSEVIVNILSVLEELEYWQEESIKEAVKSFGESRDLKLGKVAQPLRAALTGSTVSPSIFEVMAVLGKDESLQRLKSLQKEYV